MGDLIEISTCLKGGSKENGDGHLSGACSDRTKGDDFKLRASIKTRLGKKFFMVRVVKHWTRLPREVVNTPSLETFQSGLDRALGSLV